VLLASPQAHVIASDLRARRTPLSDVLAVREGMIARVGQGDDFAMIGGKVWLDPASARLLLDALPRYVVARGIERVQWVMHELAREQADGSPGASVASAQLAHLMFIHVLRAHLASDVVGPGWLRAVVDRRLEPALRKMHADPGHSWQLGELAKAAAMSRSAFAAHFTAVANCSPIAYLTEWRIHLARRVLSDDPQASLGELATKLGYASQSSFSNAFKRVTGSAPTLYRPI
jgi:AraC-like DNA-binding protein